MELELRPSRYLMGLLLLLHVGAMTMILTLSLQWWAIVIIAVVLMLSLIFYTEKYVRYRLKSSIRSLNSKDGVKWQLTTKAKESITATILGDSLVTHYLLILNFKANNKKRYTVIILRDSIDKQQFRQLRLLLINRLNA